MLYTIRPMQDMNTSNPQWTTPALCAVVSAQWVSSNALAHQGIILNVAYSAVNPLTSHGSCTIPDVKVAAANCGPIFTST